MIAATDGEAKPPAVNGPDQLRAAVVALFGARADQVTWALDHATAGGYVARVASPGVWGGEIELLASDVLRRPVYVFSAGDDRPLPALLAAPPLVEDGMHNSGAAARVLLNGTNHYDTVGPLAPPEWEAVDGLEAWRVLDVASGRSATRFGAFECSGANASEGRSIPGP